MKKILSAFLAMSISCTVLGKGAEVTSVNEKADIISHSTCWRKDNTSVKFSELVIGYIAQGLQISHLNVSSDYRFGGKDGMQKLYDFDVSLSDSVSSFNKTFLSCSAD